MKIIHVLYSLGYGGVETMLVNIANEQTRYNEDISILVINDVVVRELIDKLSPKIHLFFVNRKIGKKSLSFIKKIGQCLDSFKPDVIHLHDGSLYDYIPKRWRENKTCRVCSTLHAMPQGTCGMPWRFVRIVGNVVFHHGDLALNTNRVKQVYAISNSVKSALKAEYGVESILIHNGIYTDVFKQRELKKYKEELRIVQVGRLLHEKKGQDLLIEAIDKLIKKGFKCRLDFIGDGESMGYLKDMVDEMRLNDIINFLGAKSQDYISMHLCDYDLFVQPSRYEGFGLTVAEAMAAKVPVLVSSGQGPEEVTRGDLYGWVFQNGEIVSLTESIEQIYSNYELCLEKVESARNYVCNSFDVRETANRYIKEYQKLLTMER